MKNPAKLLWHTKTRTRGGLVGVSTPQRGADSILAVEKKEENKKKKKEQVQKIQKIT